MRTLLTLSLLCTAVGLKPTAPRARNVAAAPIGSTFGRRSAIVGALASISGVAPLIAHAANLVDADGMLATYKEYPGLGLSKAEAAPGSMPFVDVLRAIKDKKVEGVIFYAPFGDEAYAILDGKAVRIGQGWPVEVTNSQQTPRVVIPVLETEEVPYAVCASAHHLYMRATCIRPL